MRALKLLAYVLIPVAFLGVAAAAWSLWLTLEGTGSDLSDRPEATPLTSVAAVPERAPPRRWVALFGEPQPPSAPKVEPQSPTPPKPAGPPLESLGYRLKGVIRISGEEWAMVSHPTGELLLRTGDQLTEGVNVLEISAEGLWVGHAEDRRLLAFEEGP